MVQQHPWEGVDTLCQHLSRVGVETFQHLLESGVDPKCVNTVSTLTHGPCVLAGVHGAGGCTFVSSLATCSGGSSLEGSRVRGFEGSIPAGLTHFFEMGSSALGVW